MIVEPFAQTLGNEFWLPVPGQCDKRRACFRGTKLSSDLEAIHAGHAQVEQDKCRPELGRGSQCRWPVIGSEGFMAIYGQQQNKRIGVIVVVIDDKKRGSSDTLSAKGLMENVIILPL